MAGQKVIVSILADTKKFSSAMKRLANETGLSRLSNGFKNAGRRVANFVKTGVKGAAAFTAAIAGLALKGGFERALNIEDAQAALRGLGHDTESIEKIMDSALDSVRGTAFGLGDAAQIAATAVAAGIEPGEALTRTLKLTANTAALTKTSLGEMGSILNKVWTAGKVSTNELNQLADRGIPIWTSLAEHYGVNADELRKMVSAGKVDAATFADVLENTVGTAADEMGKTTRGMAQNTMAALSRVGESFLKEVFPMFAEGLGGIIGFLDDLAPHAASAGEAFGEWVTGTAVPAVKRVGAWIRNDLLPVLKELWGILSGAVRTALDTISGALDDAGVSGDKLGASIGGKLLGALRKAGPVLAKLITSGGKFVAWLIDSRDVLVPLAVAVATAVGAWATFNKVMAIARAVQIAFNVAMAANPIGLIITAVAALVAGLIWFFTQTELGQKIVEDVWGFIQDAIAAVVDWWENDAWPAIKGTWDAITDVFEAGAQLVGDFLNGAWEVIKKVWSYSPLGLIVTNWDKIVDFFKSIPGKVKAQFERAIAIVKSLWSYSPLGLIVTNWDKIIGFFKKIPGRVKNVFNTAITWLKQAGIDIIQGLRDAVTKRWEMVKNWLSGRREAVTSPLRNAGTWLVQSGKEVIAGLVRGLKSMAAAPVNAIRDIGSNLKAGFNRVLGIASPAREMIPSGEDTVEGVEVGIHRRRKYALDQLRDLGREIAGTDLGSPTLNVNPGPGRRGGNTYHITVNVPVGASLVQAGREVVRAIDAFERVNGGRRGA